MNVQYIDHMGDDKRVALAARVSFGFGETTDDFTTKDEKLIKFLARGCTSDDWDSAIQFLMEHSHESKDKTETAIKQLRNMPIHWSPFSHCMISVLETVPLFVARQRFKHTVGFTYNEVSRRYVDTPPEIFTPDAWRMRPDASIKQGSEGIHPMSDRITDAYNNYCDGALKYYQSMIDNKVAPEQARMVLPNSMYTSYWATGSLYAWANAYIQRSDSHAQYEIRKLAKAWNEIIEPLFPVSWAALTQ